MARAARYGNIDPHTFEDMDWDEGIEVARRVTMMAQRDDEAMAELHVENTKAILRGLGVKGVR